MPEPLMRLTQQAYAQLEQTAENRPELWKNPETNFGDVLESAGVPEFQEPVGIDILPGFELQPGESKTPNHWDKQGLDYYQSLPGMTPELASDHLIWAWLTHFRHHAYNLRRWRTTKRTNWKTFVIKHWLFPEKGGDRIENIQTWNGPGRTWWIAHTARRAAEASNGTITETEALDLYAKHAVYYHALLSRTLTRNGATLAAVTVNLIRHCKGMKTEDGINTMLRELNLRAGVILVDDLPYFAVRDSVEEIAIQIMSNPELVQDPAQIRNVKPFRSISLGGGVQSTVLALMAERGEHGLPKPDAAIFADTGWEPQAVYDHLDWLEKQLSYPLYRVSAGNIRDNILAGKGPKQDKYLGIPAHLTDSSGKNAGMASRQCTANYKIKPIHEKLRELMGAPKGRRMPKGQRAEIWIGISADEVTRAKPSREEWSVNRHPLMELGLGRAQLINWFNENYPGRYLPRSACIGCPYKNDSEWKWLRDNAPQAFKDAEFVDWALREIPLVRDAITRNGNHAYLHRQRKPLAEINLDQVNDYDAVMAEECEGVCAV